MNPPTPSGGGEESGLSPLPALHDEHPEFIPADHADAYQRIGLAVAEDIKETSDTTFLRAWWALCWLHPGIHPDDHEEWPRASWREFATEAFRRAESGSIRDDELYPAEAVRNRLWRARLAADESSQPLGPSTPTHFGKASPEASPVAGH